MKGNTKQHIKNVRRILTYIRDYDSITTYELQKLTHYSNSNVAAIITELSSSEYIVGSAIASGSVGRKTIAYSINPNKHFIIGIDFNTTGFLIVVTDLGGDSKLEKHAPLHQGMYKDDILNVLYQSLDQIFKIYSTDKIIHIGISVQANVDTQNGISKYLSAFADWENIPMQTILEERYHIPTILVHDTDCLMRTEKSFGVLKEKQINDALLINFKKYGCGMSLLLNGQIYTGVHGYAGEIGRLILPSANGLNYICLDQITNDIQKDASVVHTYFQQTADLIGYLLATVANLFNPQCIIMYGDLFKHDPSLEDALYDLLKKYTYDKTLLLEFSNQQDNSAAIGAALYAAEHVLNNIVI